LASALVKYYRLESAWGTFDEYFSGRVAYTSVRQIDSIESHRIPITPAVGQDFCGLWILEDPDDAIKFWDNEPYGDRNVKSANAYHALTGFAPTFPAGRFCIRIDSDAFCKGVLYSDLPLVHMYPSSKFHPALFSRQENERRPSAISGFLVRQVTLPDHFVEVYFKGRWYTKSDALGRALRRAIERARNIDDMIPTPGFAGTPVGQLKSTQMPAPAQVTAPADATGTGLRAWLSRALGWKASQSD